MFEINEYDDYLALVFQSHPDLLEMETAIAEEFSHPHYADKNDIWVFNENLPDIDLLHFHFLEQFIRLVFPRKASHRKTAIVVSSQLGVTVAQVWKHSEALPCELKIFQSLEKAKQWITASEG